MRKAVSRLIRSPAWWYVYFLVHAGTVAAVYEWAWPGGGPQQYLPQGAVGVAEEVLGAIVLPYFIVSILMIRRAAKGGPPPLLLAIIDLLLVVFHIILLIPQIQ